MAKWQRASCGQSCSPFICHRCIGRSTQVCTAGQKWTTFLQCLKQRNIQLGWWWSPYELYLECLHQLQVLQVSHSQFVHISKECFNSDNAGEETENVSRFWRPLIRRWVTQKTVKQKTWTFAICEHVALADMFWKFIFFIWMNKKKFDSIYSIQKLNPESSLGKKNHHFKIQNIH